jgi:sporulation protein YlmC with PRC-barrel domain
MVEQAGTPQMPQTPQPARTDEWRASHLFHRPVVHAQRVEHIGVVADVALDPESSALAGLLVGPPGPEGDMLDVVRRAVGRDLGLAFVPAEHILALDGDVIMVELSRGQGSRRTRLPRFTGSQPATRWPQLRHVQGYAVVTMQGQWLGRLVDLVLDPAGRHINGYLINPNAPMQPSHPRVKRPSTPAAKTDTRTPEPKAPTSLLVVPASAYVRVGRDLIAVGIPPGAHWDRPGMGPRLGDGRAPEWPAPTNRQGAEPGGAAGPDWRHAGDMRYPPDAPTEAL